jgi:hypothetical protein
MCDWTTRSRTRNPAGVVRRLLRRALGQPFPADGIVELVERDEARLGD